MSPVKVRITYCAECGYEPQTLDLARVLMLEFGAELSAIELRVMDLVIPEASAGPCRFGDNMAVTAASSPPTAEPAPRAGRGFSGRA